MAYIVGADQSLCCLHEYRNLDCVNLKHLSFEPHCINNNRLVCKNDGECCGHRGFSDCIL